MRRSRYQGGDVSGLVRRIVGAGIALVCVALLSSCSLLRLPPSPLYDDSKQQTDVQVQRIADAVKHHDADALKKLFSSRARDEATDLDGGLKYFLSAFPSGAVTWKSQGISSWSENESLTRVIELYGNYEVLAGGKKFDLYFAYFSVNDFDPDNTGIYALGITPHSASPTTASGAKLPFDIWASQFGISDKDHMATGDPGVYTPQD